MKVVPKRPRRTQVLIEWADCLEANSSTWALALSSDVGLNRMTMTRGMESKVLRYSREKVRQRQHKHYYSAYTDYIDKSACVLPPSRYLDETGKNRYRGASKQRIGWSGTAISGMFCEPSIDYVPRSWAFESWPQPTALNLILGQEGDFRLSEDYHCTLRPAVVITRTEIQLQLQALLVTHSSNNPYAPWFSFRRTSVLKSHCCKVYEPCWIWTFKEIQVSSAVKG